MDADWPKLEPICLVRRPTLITPVKASNSKLPTRSPFFKRALPNPMIIPARFCIPLPTLWLLLGGSAVLAAEPVDFSRDIRPILSRNCFACHGPDKETREAELRLDSEAALFADRGGYAAVVPGDAEHSEVVYRIFAEEEAGQMPPPDSKLSLTDDEKRLVRRWIEEGAAWERHWAFAPVQRPAVPEVSQQGWCRNPLDSFILARLEAEGVTPAAEAGKETLIRRVTLDLIGLPPTPAEVDAFLADDSPEAYAKVVDRLLSSPSYGEHTTQMWLNAARYADTDGYQNDGPRDMWRWRDWVIEAYNQNTPFDRFTVEQLAGDLVPDATIEQRIATGFNRNHRYNSEAGLVVEEFLLENAVDRVDTTSTVWMGLTMGCARCHDHKYDPVSQREYYQLIAYFDNVSESGRAVKFGNSEPWIVAPTEEQQEQLQNLTERVDKAAAALGEAEESIAAAQAKWEAVDSDDDWMPLVSDGLAHRFELEGEHSDAEAESGTLEFGGGVIGRAPRLDGKTTLSLGKAGDVQCQERSSISFWLRPKDVRAGVILSRQTQDTRRSGFAVEIRDGHLQFFIITRWVAGVGAVESMEQLQPGEWVHVCLTNDGRQSARGMKIFINGALAETKSLYNTNSNTGGTSPNTLLRVGGGVHGARFRGTVDELRFYDRTLWPDEIALLATATEVREILRKAPAERTQAQVRKLRAYYLEHAAPPKWKRLQDQWFQSRTAWLKFCDQLPTTMVMDESDPPRPTHVRLRGEYNKLGERVQPNVPSLFPPMPNEAQQNRLGFARWLVSGDHPLTARVAVNRYWQRYFGTGLVRTSDDFGIQGELPSHPKLLDWLADEFVRADWDIKAMQRLIVNSATYRQSSRGRAELAEMDPENRLLARGPRLRLSAQTLRDQALFASGLLVGKPGGPSVSPYQPAGLWETMSNMTYRQSKGADLYRRSLYTIWKRTLTPPSMSILDAPARENCTVRPQRTNTPLQALTLLNEMLFVEAARNLGQRMILEGGERPIEFAFRTLTARLPTDSQMHVLRQAREEYLAEFQRDPLEAKKLITVGESEPNPELDPVELAAITAVANVLFNLDEVINKE